MNVIEEMERAQAVLAAYGINMDHLLDTRAKLIMKDEKPCRILLPSIRILGCDLEFAEVPHPIMKGDGL